MIWWLRGKTYLRGCIVYRSIVWAAREGTPGFPITYSFSIYPLPAVYIPRPNITVRTVFRRMARSRRNPMFLM